MTVTAEEFRALVAAAIDELPLFFRRKMENVYVAVEDRPGPEVLRSQGLRSPWSLLGLYQGYPLGKRGHYSNVLPDRIVIYRRPILRLCRTDAEVGQKVREVLIHELAHHFGFSEEELAAAEDFG